MVKVTKLNKFKHGDILVGTKERIVEITSDLVTPMKDKARAGCG